MHRNTGLIPRAGPVRVEEIATQSHNAALQEGNSTSFFNVFGMTWFKENLTPCGDRTQTASISIQMS